MGKNTSVSLGPHYEAFIEERISKGRFQNTSEVIRAGLRLLEEEENRFIQLSKAIKEGISGGIAEDFPDLSGSEHRKKIGFDFQGVAVEKL